MGGKTYPVWNTGTTPVDTSAYTYMNLAARHNEVGNVGFLDGHSKAMNYEVLYNNRVDDYFNPAILQ